MESTVSETREIWSPFLQEFRNQLNLIVAVFVASIIDRMNLSSSSKYYPVSLMWSEREQHLNACSLFHGKYRSDRFPRVLKHAAHP